MLAYKIFACYYFSRLLNRAVMHMCFKFYSINLEDYIYMLVDCFFGIPHTGLEGISVLEPRRLKSNTTCMTPEVVVWLVLPAYQRWAVGTLLSNTAVQPRRRRNTIHHRYAHIMVQWNRSTVVRLLSIVVHTSGTCRPRRLYCYALLTTRSGSRSNHAPIDIQTPWCLRTITSMHFLKSPEGYVFLWQYLAYELECMVHIFFLLLK